MGMPVPAAVLIILAAVPAVAPAVAIVLPAVTNIFAAITEAFPTVTILNGAIPKVFATVRGAPTPVSPHPGTRAVSFQFILDEILSDEQFRLYNSHPRKGHHHHGYQN
jgi:hypothetical protein